MPIEKVLVVDDDTLSREFLYEALHKCGYTVEVSGTGEDAWELFQREPADVVFTDMRMPGMTGMELLEKIKGVSPDTVVVMVTAYGAIEDAVEAMKLGAFDYLLKPVSPDQIEVRMQRLEERLALLAENKYLREALEESQGGLEAMVAQDPRMLKMSEQVKKVAQSKATVLIQGESGTGKELVAQALHRHGPRRERNFVRVNCAALSESLLESELFGHEKGAFTGAVSKREGRFELANGGTLLLDEISETSLALQSKLLRVLELEEFERVGGTKTLKVDVRVVATTNRDLRKYVDAGKFREDLYYRLNVVPILLPPLRERPGDVPLLVDHFLKLFIRQNVTRVKSISPEAMKLLQVYRWPGNIRELKNLVQRLVVIDPGEVIQAEDVSAYLPLGERRATSPDGQELIAEVGMSLDEAERRLILKTLDHTSNNKTRTAEILQVTARTLRNKLQRYREEGLLEGGDDEEEEPEGIR
jgi:DNA-binding NtrC family response regulator